MQTALAPAAVQLAREGADVVVHGRDAQRGDEVVAQIKEAGGTARFIQSELSDAADVLRLAEEAGEVDVLVNNAGTWGFHDTAGMTPELFDLLMNINTKAPYLLVQALAPGMIARGRGSIVNVTSLASTSSTIVSTVGVYAGSKAAMEQLTRIWAAEYAQKGVRVNAVVPGSIRTLGTAGTPENEAIIRQLAKGMSAMGRPGEPEEVAEAITFLASDRASYITGAVLEVRGGQPAIA